MSTATLNANCSGVWSAREGELVTIVGRAPNGLATAVLRAGARRPAYVPTRWLDVKRERPRRALRAACGILEGDDHAD